MCYSSARWSEDYAECKSCRLRTDSRGGQARKALPPMKPETREDRDLEHYRLSCLVGTYRGSPHATFREHPNKQIRRPNGSII